MVEEQKGKSRDTKAAKAPKDEEWLQSAINKIHSKEEDLESQATVNKIDFETTINRSDYQPPAVATDRIIKRGEREDFDATAKSKRSLYALTGLVLGSILSLAGLILFMRAMGGAAPWFSQAIGITSSQASDMLPGVILFIFGIFLILLTRDKPHS